MIAIDPTLNSIPLEQTYKVMKMNQKKPAADDGENVNTFKYRYSRTYFKVQTERKVLFVLTIVMLILGILYQTNVI